MMAAANTVAHSVESIAAISEENSASAEEVSAATEEMSGQAEEVVASASSLADMARRLDELVAGFHTESSRGSGRAAAEPEKLVSRHAGERSDPAAGKKSARAA